MRRVTMLLKPSGWLRLALFALLFLFSSPAASAADQSPQVCVPVIDHRYDLSLLSVQRTDVVGVESKLIFVSTLSGWLRAVEPWTGEVRWSLKEDPVVRVPVS